MARSAVVVPGRAEYLRRWSQLHGDYDLRRSRLVRGWLVVVYAVARLLARAGIGPGQVTLGGLGIGLSVPLVALGLGVAPRIALLCAVLTILSALTDSLDGAVAVLTGRTSRIGFVADSVADRVADLGYLAALWLAGAPGGLLAVGGALMFLQEYTRARGAAAGMDELGVVSIAERPTRIIVTAAFLLAVGVYPGAAAWWAGLGAATWVAVHAVGLVQVGIAVRRALR